MYIKSDIFVHAFTHREAVPMGSGQIFGKILTHLTHHFSVTDDQDGWSRAVEIAEETGFGNPRNSIMSSIYLVLAPNW